jgi:hypothetical protein
MFKSLCIVQILWMISIYFFVNVSIKFFLSFSPWNFCQLIFKQYNILLLQIVGIDTLKRRGLVWAWRCEILELFFFKSNQTFYLFKCILMELKMRDPFVLMIKLCYTFKISTRHTPNLKNIKFVFYGFTFMKMFKLKYFLTRFKKKGT